MSATVQEKVFPVKFTKLSKSKFNTSLLQTVGVWFVPTGSFPTLIVIIKGSPAQPFAPVGVTVYITFCAVALVLTKVSVIFVAVDATVVSPVTFGLSVATQE